MSNTTPPSSPNLEQLAMECAEKFWEKYHRLELGTEKLQGFILETLTTATASMVSREEYDKLMDAFAADWSKDGLAMAEKIIELQSQLAEALKDKERFARGIVLACRGGIGLLPPDEAEEFYSIKDSAIQQQKGSGK